MNLTLYFLKLKALRNRYPIASTISIAFLLLLIIIKSLYSIHSNIKIHRVANSSDNDFDRFHIKYIYPEIIDHLQSNYERQINTIDWSKYAYSFYATNPTTLCNVFILINQLKKFNSKANFIVMVNKELIKDQSQYQKMSSRFITNDIKLKPIDLYRPRREDEDEQIYDKEISSFIKLEVFNQFQYERIIYLDTDSILPHGHLDELFFLPPVKLAIPTAYWLTREKYLAEENQQLYNKPELLLDASKRNSKISNILIHLKQLFGSNYNPIKTYHDLNSIQKQKLYYNELYNSLPTYEQLDDLVFSSSLMVIMPTSDISTRLNDSFQSISQESLIKTFIEHEDNTANVLKTHAFNPSSVITHQLTREKTINDIPDLLIIPHQIYGCLSNELNVVTDHRSFLADPQDQPFIDSDYLTSDEIPYYGSNLNIINSEIWFPKVKYLKFFDNPIPKPWFQKDDEAEYMSNKVRCKDHPTFDGDYIGVRPMGFTKDCQAGVYWDYYHRQFAKLRMNVCGLELIV